MVLPGTGVLPIVLLCNPCSPFSRLLLLPVSWETWLGTVSSLSLASPLPFPSRSTVFSLSPSMRFRMYPLLPGSLIVTYSSAWSEDVHASRFGADSVEFELVRFSLSVGALLLLSVGRLCPSLASQAVLPVPSSAVSAGLNGARLGHSGLAQSLSVLPCRSPARNRMRRPHLVFQGCLSPRFFLSLRNCSLYFPACVCAHVQFSLARFLRLTRLLRSRTVMSLVLLSLCGASGVSGTWFSSLTMFSILLSRVGLSWRFHSLS